MHKGTAINAAWKAFPGLANNFIILIPHNQVASQQVAALEHLVTIKCLKPIVLKCNFSTSLTLVKVIKI